MLLDLLDKLEDKMGDDFELLQSNTDGIIVKINDTEIAKRRFKHICDNWCWRTRMGLSIDELGAYIAKDVNNYLVLNPEGKIVERHGAYVKENSPLDNDLPILNEALINYITKGIPVEDTINNCEEFIKFQLVFKVASDYKYAVHNGKRYNEKVFRVFASKDEHDGYLGRCREEGSNPDKFQNCPEHCFIWNDSVKGVPIPLKLKKDWYINLARKRLEDFGYDVKNPYMLF